MKATDYLEILQNELVDSVLKLEIEREFIFQQDNDPKHTAKIVKKFFDEKHLKVLDWPAQSPDLNPIGHLWEELGFSPDSLILFQTTTLIQSTTGPIVYSKTINNFL